MFVDETREVISSSDAQDLFLWRVIDSDQKSGPTQANPIVYGHNSHEMYLDFDYCASLDLFIGCTISRTFVMYGDKCQVHLANFATNEFNVTCLKIDRGSDIILAGTTQGSLLLFSLVHVFQILRFKMSNMEAMNGSRLAILKHVCQTLGFFEENDDERMDPGLNSMMQISENLIKKTDDITKVKEK
jgi:hypothetical protein